MQAKEKSNHQYLQHLPKVTQYLSQLEEQNMWWTTVAMVGKINSEAFHPQLLASIVETQKEFQQLRDLMIDSLVGRYLHQAHSDIKIKTQASIDLIIRNLFERTADVGFLATDDDIVAFMQNPNPTQEQQSTIEQRLQEYVAKYSVYDDIVLVKPDGRIVAKLNDTNTSEHSTDPVIRQALNDQATPYQEFLRATDLFPQRSRSLVYAKRIVSNSADNSKSLGVLCLSFRFEQEMAMIFNKLTANTPDYQIMLCHQSGEVLASSHPEQQPVGTVFEHTPLTDEPINKHNQFSFFTKTTGYEGYMGLPWLGHIVLENQAAFKEKSIVADHQFHVTPDSPLYLKQLEKTNIKVSTLLLIVILNGKISSLKQNVEYFLPILDRFQDISQDISAIFDDFIQHIHQVLVETVKDKVVFSASLAAEIMDRNLYERANDCRWWALNPRFRQILTQHSSNTPRTEQHQKTLDDNLKYINQLYTVYTNILIYDLSGVVIAVSNPQELQLIGQHLSPMSDVKKCLELKDSQHYVVSKFEATPLYNNQPTYVYHAAIKAWDKPNQNVGGIALVFDSQPQFSAMLKDSEPSFLIRSIQEQSFGLFVHPDGTVISSTNPDLTPGLVINLPEQLKTIQTGDIGSLAWTFNQHNYIVGYEMTRGYREYKTQDGYSNPVISLTLTPI